MRRGCGGLASLSTRWSPYGGGRRPYGVSWHLQLDESRFASLCATSIMLALGLLLFLLPSLEVFYLVLRMIITRNLGA
jgi:hypothetical protein